MDNNIKNAINIMFTEHFADIYQDVPNIKVVENTNCFYTTSGNSNVICLLNLDYLNKGNLL